jgi:hypothetical protein
MPVDEFDARFGGAMSESEIAFARQLKEEINRVLAGGLSFQVFAARLRRELQSILKADLQVGPGAPAALANHMRQSDAAPVPPLTAAEQAFLRDMAGLLTHAVANGLLFSAVVGVIGHDCAEIVLEGSLDAAIGAGFRPKCDGWAELSVAPVGESEGPLA